MVVNPKVGILTEKWLWFKDNSWVPTSLTGLFNDVTAVKFKEPPVTGIKTTTDFMAVLQYDPSQNSGSVIVQVDNTAAIMTVVKAMHLSTQFPPG